MKLTAKMKKWLVEECDVKATASDNEFKKAAGVALAEGKLSAEKLMELSTTKDDEEANEVSDLFKGIASALTEVKDALKGSKETKAAEGEELEAEEEESTKATKDAKATTPAGTKGGAKHVPSTFEKMVTRMAPSTMDIEDDADGEKSYPIRIKDASERYSSEKSAAVYPVHNEKGKAHPLAGQPMRNMDGRQMDNPSDLDKAVAGVYMKFLIQTARVKSRNIAFAQLPDHDRDLLCHAMEKMPWAGSTRGDDREDIGGRKLTLHEQKALIDDATSGGLEAAPIVFDDQVIQAPLLNGELFPLVSQKPLDRGRRVEGVATGTVTGSWGGVDDTAIALFNTASYVTAFDTTIFRWEGAIRVGLDFLSDTPIDFGAHITEQYGERLLEDLDDVIAVGNGSTQPEGITVKSGTTSVSFGGSTSIGNYESLRFGVAKKEHKSGVKASAVFCGTETSYQRARAIPVGASDARRLGGMDYDSYSWMQRPYKINESLSNSQIFYAILARYRMYRRRGLTMRQSTEGDTLIRANEMLMVAMARYGGQLERGAVAAVTSTAPA